MNTASSTQQNQIEQTRRALSEANRRLQAALGKGDFMAEAKAFTEQEKAFRAYQTARLMVLR